MIYEDMNLANKFLPTTDVEIPNSRNTVAFETPMVLKKPPFESSSEQIVHQLSHQPNHLASPSRWASPVTDWLGGKPVPERIGP
jgi:hypothetical protein